MIQNNKTIASILFVLISFVCSAQTTPPPPPQPPTGPPGTPIDGAIMVFLLLGALYGAYKVYTQNKRII